MIHKLIKQKPRPKPRHGKAAYQACAETYGANGLLGGVLGGGDKI